MSISYIYILPKLKSEKTRYTGTSSRNNSKKLLYLSPCSAILIIVLLLLSTPILTAFGASSYSSLVIDKSNNNDLNYLKKGKELPSALSSLLSDDFINTQSSSSSSPSSTSSTPSSSTPITSFPTELIPSAPAALPPSNNMLTSSYFADKENPFKNKDSTKSKEIKECINCFISELKKIDNKRLADQILKDIEKEFGSLSKLCKLIDNGDINRDQLEHILYSILFGNQHHNYKFIDAKIKNSFIQNVLECLFPNLDLAVANRGDGTVSILLGNGDGTFGTANNFDVAFGPTSVVVGLFNADYNLDLAVANINGNTVSILLGNGDGTFGTATNFDVGNTPTSVAVGLFNADENLDLAVSNSGDGTVSILLGDGLGTFGPANNFDVGFGPASVAVGEFNTS